MTNDKAIKWLKVEASYIEENVGHGKEILEAYDMATKALEKEPCDDAISRQAAIDAFEDTTFTKNEILRRLLELPSVTPQPKTGHWIDIMVGDMPAQACDQCNTFYPLAYTGGGHKYCPNCGARMEVSE